MIRIILVLLCSAITTLAMSQVSSQDPALVTTTGFGKVYSVPDEVHFTIEINTEGENLVDAKTENAQLAAKAINYLKSQGVADRYIQTAYLNVNVQYRDRARVNPRYFASQNIEICLKDISTYEQLTFGLLELGITGLRGPRFKSTRSEELRAEARILAVKDARTRASAMAKALGQSISEGAYSITNAQSDRGPQMAYARSAMSESNAGSADGPGFAAGELEFSEMVTASFYLR